MEKNMKKTLWGALLEFQKHCDLIVEMDKEVAFGSTKYRYASFANILKKIKKPLNDAGLTYRQQIKDGMIVTIITHAETGESFAGVPVPILPDFKNYTGKMQELGARITYARRYSLVTTLGVVADEDIDSPDVVKKEKVKISNAKPKKAMFETVIDGIKNTKTEEDLEKKKKFLLKELEKAESGGKSSMGLTKGQIEEALELAETIIV